MELPNCETVEAEAFCNCYNLSEVTLPVCTTLSTGAFSGCSNLTGVSLNTIASLPNAVFSGCSNLTSIYIPAIQYIGDYTFCKCGISSLSLSSVQLSDNAFAICSNLSSVNLIDCSIGSSVFRNCSRLTAISLTNCNINYRAFIECSNLRTIQWSSCTLAGSEIFAWCYNLSQVLDVPILNNSIPSGIFNNCYSLNSVTFAPDNTVTDIGYAAFSECHSFLTIPWPSVKTFESSCFANCYDLKIPNSYFKSCISIGNYAFLGCKSLITELDAPNLTYIGDYAFYSCSTLSSFSLPNCSYIGNNAFEGANFESINILHYLYSVGGFANNKRLKAAKFESVNQFTSSTFYGCSQLESVYIFTSNIPNIYYGTGWYG